MLVAKKINATKAAIINFAPTFRLSAPPLGTAFAAGAPWLAEGSAAVLLPITRLPEIGILTGVPAIVTPGPPGTIVVPSSGTAVGLAGNI